MKKEEKKKVAGDQGLFQLEEKDGSFFCSIFFFGGRGVGWVDRNAAGQLRSDRSH